MRDVKRILKGGILALLGYFGHLAEIFMIGCSFISLMKILPPKCRIMGSFSNVACHLTYVSNLASLSSLNSYIS
jgi:hypothetical protein